MTMDPTFHLVLQSDFDALEAGDDYAPRDFEREGFIHCTDAPEEMARVANMFYRSNPKPHYYLYIDKTRVRAPIRYDDAEQHYPHIYGTLNRDAIVAVRPAQRTAGGAFLPPERLDL